jgi:hypothetical protein
MISYLYWLAVFGFVFVVGVAAFKTKFIKTGAVVIVSILLVAWSLYYFKYEQNWVKNYGGTMTISVPKGLIHLGTTWKDEHLWIENYDPKTNTCYFSEYSKGHLLQGEVVIKHCNPALPSANPEPAQVPQQESDIPKSE